LPTAITFLAINSNSPQQNAGVFIGEINITGWDANGKFNYGHGAIYGFFNVLAANASLNFDGMELIDGVINDQDLKPNWSVQL